MLYTLKVDALVTILVSIVIFATIGFIFTVSAIWQRSKSFAAKLTQTHAARILHVKLQQRSV
jgi:hypothetical protein